MKSISVASSGERIDIYLFHLFPDLTRSRIQSLIKSQNILLNNKPTKPSFILNLLESSPPLMLHFTSL